MSKSGQVTPSVFNTIGETQIKHPGYLSEFYTTLHPKSSGCYAWFLLSFGPHNNPGAERVVMAEEGIEPDLRSLNPIPESWLKRGGTLLGPDEDFPMPVATWQMLLP